MKKLLWLLFLLTVPTVTFAQDVEVRPGETTTFSFMVSSEGEYKANLDVPEGWCVSLFEERSTKSLQLVRVRSPEKTKVGKYEIVFTAMGVSKRRIVKVPEMYDVSASFSLDSRYVPTGNKVYGSLALTNNSNVPVNLFISGDNSRNIELGVGEEKVLRIQKTVKNKTTFVVKIENKSIEKHLKTFSKTVQPVSVSKGASIRQYEFPLEVGMRSSYEDAGSSSQFWTEGTASVERGSETVFDFLIETPPLQSLNRFSLFPNRSTYRATIRNPSYSIRLGDQFFRTSTLGGEGTTGFGIGVEREYERLKIKWSYAGTRRPGLERKQYHMFSSYDLTESLYVGGNFTHINNGFVGNTFSLESGLNQDQISVLGEIGIDLGTGISYAIDGSIKNSDGYIRLAAEQFSDKNVSFERGSKNYEVEIGTEIYNTNISTGFFKDTGRFYSGRTFRFDLNRDHFGAYYKNEQINVGSTENTVGGRASFRTEMFSVRSRTQLSWISELEEYYSFTVGYDGFSNSVTYENDRFHEELEIDASYSYDFQNGLRANGGVSLQNHNGDWRESFDINVSRRFDSGYAFRVRGSYQNYFRERWGIEFEASKKIGVPVHKDRSVGLVTGKVVDENGDSVSGVILLIGDKATKTNSDGKYAVNLPVGEHSIRVLPQNLSINQIVRNTAKDVHVNGAQQTRRTVRLIEGASVGGTVLEKNGSFRSGVVVVLTNGKRTFRRVSDENGKVRFNAVPPGSWKVSLAKNLNDVTLISEKKIGLSSAEQKSVSLTVESEEDVIFLDNEK